MKTPDAETIQKVKLGSLAGAIGTVVVWFLQTLVSSAEMPPDVTAAVHIIVIWVVLTVAGYVTPKKPVDGPGKGAAAALLALVLVAAPAAQAQDVTRSFMHGDTEFTITVSPDRIAYDVPGMTAEIPRDVMALASDRYPHHLDNVKLFDIILDGPVEWPPFEPSELTEALAELEALVEAQAEHVSQLNSQLNSEREKTYRQGQTIAALTERADAAEARIEDLEAELAAATEAVRQMIQRLRIGP